MFGSVLHSMHLLLNKQRFYTDNTVHDMTDNWKATVIIKKNQKRSQQQVGYLFVPNAQLVHLILHGNLASFRFCEET